MSFRERKFKGEDPILLLNFLTSLVEEADTVDISEGQMIVLARHLLIKYDGEQYHARTNASLAGASGGIFHWAKAVRHLLRTYATEIAIREAIDDFREVRQSPTEKGTAYA